MIRVAKELPVVQEVDLLNLVQEISQDLDPYGRRKPQDSPPDKNLDPHHPKVAPGNTKTSTSVNSSTARPVVASRIKWEHSPAFDPIPYFTDSVVRDAFADPATVKLPSHQWVEKPKGRVHCSRHELLKLAEKWDSKGACRIFRLDQINEDEAVGIFAVAKDEQYDRLILNPQRVNARLRSFSHYTKSLAPGSLFAMIRLEQDQVLRISADDLAEMYYTIKIPELRAKRNCIGLRFAATELSHLQCFDPHVHFGTCFVALNALAMGDSWAVEFAQQAHHNVLKHVAGCMLDHQRVAYRKPFPRSSFLEWLSIDDHIGVQIVSKAHFKQGLRARDTEVFERATEAYSEVGLVQHPKKKRREVQQGIFIGAEVDGAEGLVSAPRDRIGTLMLCTMLVVQRGCCSPALLSSLLGCWIHVLMFRRPILSVLSHSFSEGSNRPRNEVFMLSRQCRNELAALALLGPMCISDMRVAVAPAIYCTDASPAGGGICVCPEDPQIVGELWRHSEQRGFYAPLLNPAASILSEMGLEHLDIEMPEGPDWLDQPEIKIPPPLSEGIVYDCIELFKGEGNWSSAHAAAGFSVHGGMDVCGDSIAFRDLLDDSVFHQLTALALRRVVRDWHAGPPCYTYGTLRLPRLRSKTCPAGFNPKDPLTWEQTRLALRTAFLMWIVVTSGLFFSIEQPGSSVMFRLQIFKRLVFAGCVITRLCFCSFGSPFKKPSQWLHNKPWLLEFEMPCRCQPGHQHFVIEGSFTRRSVEEFDAMCRPGSEHVYGRKPRIGEAVSAFSASYPKGFCRRVAVAARQSLSDAMRIIPLGEVVRSCSRIDEPVNLPKSVLSEPVMQPRQFHEDPEWVNELAVSLPFKELLRYKFHKSGHINVLESRVHKTWLKHCARVHPNARVLGLLDSRVTLGATAKGRSSSKAICRVLQGSLGYIIGGCLYPGGMHIGSKFNPSDAPSRNRPVPKPCKEVPDWLRALRAGNFELFDLQVTAGQFPKNAARWLRLLLLLGGDIERNLGPGGPNAAKRVPRGRLNLSVGFAPATSKRMSSCLKLFNDWLIAEVGITLEALGWDTLAAPLALRAYGMHLYQHGFPRYLFVYAITGLQDSFPHLKAFLTPAWAVDRKWQIAEPGECRPVLSAPVIRALTSLCILWRWFRFLGVVLIGFLGMLHPAEFLQLRRRDLLLPQDSLHSEPVFYIHISNPKTSRFARRQHCKIDDSLVLSYVTKVFGPLQPGECLFGGGPSAVRRRWDAALSRLGIPTSQREKGATPAVLRGSGATFMYLASEDLAKVQWRGRWSQLKTVEHYVQEVAAQTLVSQLDPLSKRRVKAFDEAAAFLLRAWASSAIVRKVVAFSRPFTVSFVVVVILGQNSPNVFGMLYLIWLVGLAISGAWASYINSGWDLLRANEFTWRSLLVLSNCIVLALAYCQVMESKNFDFVGLERSTQTILEVTWAHLTIGVLAGLQTLAFSQKVLIPAMFVDSNSALAWFLWIGGIFIEMGLMLNFVMMEPLTVDSFFILTLFLGIVAVEQFGAPARWRNWLLTATAFFCSLLLVLRYTLLMPKVQEWLAGASSPLPKGKFDMLWKAFALGDTSFEVRLKLGYLAATMLLSTALRRLYRFGAAASLIGARSQVYIMKNKVAMSIFLEAARWSTVVLICTCYFIMPLKNALSHLQLAVLILMLMSGRCWDYAGGFISLTSSITLLVQYAYTFKLVELPEDQANYWGLHQQGYYAEVALLLIGIVQRTVKRLSLHFLSNTTIAAQLNEQARERRRRIRQVRPEVGGGELKTGQRTVLNLGVFVVQRFAAMVDCLGFMSHGLIYGTAVWLAFGLVCTTIASKFFVKETPRITKEESSQLAMVVVWVSTICMWLFWAFVYMHQMVPLIYPVRAPGA
eukprot:s2396_g12.t1